VKFSVKVYKTICIEGILSESTAVRDIQLVEGFKWKEKGDVLSSLEKAKKKK